MRLLLDTHTLLWWWDDDPRLPAIVRDAIADAANAVFVSAASGLEIAIKVRLGKLPQAARRIHLYRESVTDDGFQHLPIREEHAVRAGLLAGDHRDPFDRAIAAQGLIEDLTVATRDPEIAAFGCATIW